MLNADSYLTKAAECLAILERIRDPKLRLILLNIAGMWHALALKAEQEKEAHGPGAPGANERDEDDQLH